MLMAYVILSCTNLCSIELLCVYTISSVSSAAVVFDGDISPSTTLRATVSLSSPSSAAVVAENRYTPLRLPICRASCVYTVTTEMGVLVYSVERNRKAMFATNEVTHLSVVCQAVFSCQKLGVLRLPTADLNGPTATHGTGGAALRLLDPPSRRRIVELGSLLRFRIAAASGCVQ